MVANIASKILMVANIVQGFETLESIPAVGGETDRPRVVSGADFPDATCEKGDFSTYLPQPQKEGARGSCYLPTSRYLARVSSCLLAFCAFWRVFASVLCL